MAPRACTNTVLNRLGTELRRGRQKFGMSQAALAAKAGIHTNVIGRIERGGYNPMILTLDAIATAFGASMVDLLRRALK
jgi:XRE family transcriptional regulator, regulator of sulfur utilization